MTEAEMNVHRDPETTPAQEKLLAFRKEFRDALVHAGVPISEAHAKVADFKAAVLDLLLEELKEDRVKPPVEYRRWYRSGKNRAWMRGLDYAQSHIFRAMMRQESWARLLRKKTEAAPHEQ